MFVDYKQACGCGDVSRLSKSLIKCINFFLKNISLIEYLGPS